MYVYIFFIQAYKSTAIQWLCTMEETIKTNIIMYKTQTKRKVPDSVQCEAPIREIGLKSYLKNRRGTNSWFISINIFSLSFFLQPISSLEWQTNGWLLLFLYIFQFSAVILLRLRTKLIARFGLWHKNYSRITIKRQSMRL